MLGVPALNLGADTVATEVSGGFPQSVKMNASCCFTANETASGFFHIARQRKV
jgi:hypothetical protein